MVRSRRWLRRALGATVSVGVVATAIAYGQTADAAEENRPPVAVDDGPFVFGVGKGTYEFGSGDFQMLYEEMLANDSDPDGDSLRVECDWNQPFLYSEPDDGWYTHPTSFICVPDGIGVTLTPTVSFAGSLDIRYRVVEDTGEPDALASEWAYVRLLFELEDGHPTAAADSVTTPYATPIDVPILANDADPEGDELQEVRLALEEQGDFNYPYSLSLIESNVLRFVPQPGGCGTVRRRYSVMDSTGKWSPPAVLSVTVGCGNGEPLAIGDTATTARDAAVDIPVTDNDQDPEGDELTAVVAATPMHGVAVGLGGAITYTPSPGFCGTDSFTYQAQDVAALVSAPATVLVTVECTNRPPTALPDAAEVTAGTTPKLSVLANDTDPDGDVLSVVMGTSPVHGAAAVVADGVAYTPALGWCGPDMFTYRASDPSGALSEPATVSVTVACLNRPPVTSIDRVTIHRGDSVNIAVLANDSDPDGTPLSVTDVSSPSSGTATINADQTVAYTASGSACRPDTFTYTASDGDLAVTGTVVVTIDCANRAPRPQPDTIDIGVINETEQDFIIVRLPVFTASGTADLLANDLDPDGDPLWVFYTALDGTNFAGRGDQVAFRIPMSASCTAGQPISRTVNYSVMDNRGSRAASSLTVHGICGNHLPRLSTPAEPVQVRAGQRVTVPLAAFNPTDADGDPVRLVAGSVVSTPRRGQSITTAADGQSFTFVAAPGRGSCSSYTVDFMVTDSTGTISSQAALGGYAYNRWGLRVLC